MLALKLHKNKQPWLGTGSFLIPIIRWQASNWTIRLWIKLLQYCKATWPNNHIRYATLVKIPDDHLVSLHFDVSDRPFDARHAAWAPNFLRLCAVDIAQKARIGNSAFRWDWPEMILGTPLPDSCIKWTKDIRVLYQAEKRNSRRPKHRRIDTEQYMI